ncbi:hypothetical protein [Acidovorax sp. K2F]|uniref:hypothetical protein n=1 Tax=Acidovorax sp. K2F TaxID=2978125 RepID=UPI0021B0AD06|nr:hypothetical protein [Acidovorax sp. K2F]MCT6721672.1 hypothetical protein [Acidovorax sp. K2F]
MNNSVSDRKLEQGLWGVSWNAAQEDLELAHPGGKWNRRTDAGTAYLEYSVKSQGMLFGAKLVGHLPLKFVFDVDGNQPLKSLSCWLRVPLGGVPSTVERIEAACGPFLVSNIRSGEYWTQFLHPGFVVLLQSRTPLGNNMIASI